MCACRPAHRSIALTGACGRCPSFFLFGLTPNKGKVAVFLKESRLKNFYARCARPLYSFSCSPAFSPPLPARRQGGQILLIPVGVLQHPLLIQLDPQQPLALLQVHGLDALGILGGLGAMSPVWNSSIRPEEAVSSTSQSSRTYRAAVKGDLSL